MIPVLIALAATAAITAPEPEPVPAAATAAASVPAGAETPAAPGTTLWDGARVGMTPAQVQAAFPAARPVADGESLLDNAKELLVLSGLHLPTGLPAVMTFYFRGDSLNEVKLAAVVPEGQTAANVHRAEALAEALKQTYGKPITCGARESLLSFECDWIWRGLSVSITYMDVAGQSPMLETTVRGIVNTEATPPRGLSPNKGAPASRLGRVPAAPAVAGSPG
jgi:hypothetical protein